MSSVMAGLAAAVLTPLILGLLSRPGRPALERGPFKVLEYSAGLRFLMLAGSLFFGLIAGLAYRYPGKTDPATLPWAIATFIFFALLNGGVFALMGRARVFWNEQELQGPNAWGKISRFDWDQVHSVEYVAWAQGFRILSSQQAAIWVSPMMNGFDEFMQELVRRELAVPPEPEDDESP